MYQQLPYRDDRKQPRTLFGIVFLMLALSACAIDLSDELGARKVVVQVGNTTPTIAKATPGNKAKSVRTNKKLAAYLEAVAKVAKMTGPAMNDKILAQTQVALSQDQVWK